MIKEEKPLFPVVLLIVVVVFFLNIINLVYKLKKPVLNLTGFSVIARVGEMYSSLPTTSKVILFIQWGILIFILLYAAFKDKNISDDKKELDTLKLKDNLRPSDTDLDVLYKLLKEKNKLSISNIARIFKIDKDLAREWGKTLEEGKLAFIDYPRFSGPVLKLATKGK